MRKYITSLIQEKILGRPPKVIIDAYSGIAGIVIWINRYFKDSGIDVQVDKKDPRVQKVKEWVDNQYENGRNTSISDDELKEVVKEVFGI